MVPDARLDPRFADNPVVLSEPGLRFYAAAPLVTPEGFALGSLCEAAPAPRDLSGFQRRALQALSRQVMAQFALHEQAQQMQKLNEQLERLSIRDELTGLNNRRAFNIALGREMVRAQRYSAPLSLILLDVDHFKSYNDTFGHQEGDYVLQRVGAVLPQHIGEMEVAARYGGEEFALILPDTSAEKALEIANSVRLELEEIHWPRRAITASFGVATTTPDLHQETALLCAADSALYAAKSAGRNRVIHCHELAPAKARNQ